MKLFLLMRIVLLRNCRRKLIWFNVMNIAFSDLNLYFTGMRFFLHILLCNYIFLFFLKCAFSFRFCPFFFTEYLEAFDTNTMKLVFIARYRDCKIFHRLQRQFHWKLIMSNFRIWFDPSFPYYFPLSVSFLFYTIRST